MKLEQGRLEQLEIMLAAFPFSLLQDFLTFQRHCKQHNIQMQEIPEFVRHFAGDVARKVERQSRKVDELFAQKAPRCSVCGVVLTLEPINDRPSRMVDDHSKSWWICQDLRCDSDPITSDKYPYEIISEMGILLHRRPEQQNLSTTKRRRAAMNQRSKRRI